MRSARRDCAKDRFLVTKLQPHDAPRNLRLFGVRRDLKADVKFGCEIMYGPISEPWPCESFGPPEGGFPLTSRTSNGMVLGEIGSRVVRTILVI